MKPARASRNWAWDSRGPIVGATEDGDEKAYDGGVEAAYAAPPVFAGRVSDGIVASSCGQLRGGTRGPSAPSAVRSEGLVQRHGTSTMSETAGPRSSSSRKESSCRSWFSAVNWS